MEYVVIAIVALLVVGPERLPMLLNKLGKMVAKARNMANEFRASFDEMARASELDELRKEVEALRQTQTNMMPLGADAEAAFKSIREDLNTLPAAAGPSSALSGPDEWPDAGPIATPVEPEPHTPVAKPRKPRAKPAVTASPVTPKAKAPAKTKTTAKAAAKPRAPRKTAARP
jgi:sec-independent protein translocase protein TatB